MLKAKKNLEDMAVEVLLVMYYLQLVVLLEVPALKLLVVLVEYRHPTKEAVELNTLVDIQVVMEEEEVVAIMEEVVDPTLLILMPEVEVVVQVILVVAFLVLE